jgi:thioredoxin reductase
LCNAGIFAFVRDLYEALIVGGGPAGLSAALVLGRACRSVLVCDDGRQRNAVAERMHGFLSRDGTPPDELLAIARNELEQYPNVEFANTHVQSIESVGDAFCAEASNGQTYTAERVLLATGAFDALPNIEGLRDAWGHSAFVCPYCDGWEVRDKCIVAIGPGRRAVELAQELYQWSADLRVCLQGKDDLLQDDRRWLEATDSEAFVKPVRRIHEENGTVRYVEFADGTQERCEAVFICAPLRPRYPLVEMLGCRVREDGEIEIDERGRTSVPGVYAAGDAVTKLHQLVLAAASGVTAAIGINGELLGQDVRASIARSSW